MLLRASSAVMLRAGLWRRGGVSGSDEKREQENGVDQAHDVSPDQGGQAPETWPRNPKIS
jgi:hypothetical protein